MLASEKKLVHHEDNTPGRDCDLDQLCNTLKVLANSQRLKILRHLLDGEAAVGELESMLGLKQPNLSHELRKLRESDIVKTRRQSKVIFYSISTESTENMIRNALNLDPKRERQHQPILSTNETIKNPLHWEKQVHNSHSNMPKEECGHFPTIQYR
ncbi:MAG: metalloregulator ArsR/SmtB family transcription factor [Gammaproteobacteria bacterium]|nr:metalloregulator ArsR/SmtB family transcription factor [Gammaproteobacteria bacterium]